jgi:hypothetical protein
MFDVEAGEEVYTSKEGETPFVKVLNWLTVYNDNTVALTVLPAPIEDVSNKKKSRLSIIYPEEVIEQPIWQVSNVSVALP